MKKESKKTNNNRGFVILFAVTVSAILLSITLGIANISLIEIKFGTSGRATNDSFFAADTGIECALMHDKGSSSVFDVDGPGTSIDCASNVTIPVSFSGTPPIPPGSGTGLYSFTVTGLNNSGTGCANVTVFKDGNDSPPYVKTRVISKGYNIGNASCSPDPDRIEREIETNY